MQRGTRSRPGALTRSLAAVLSNAFDDAYITQEHLANIIGTSDSTVSRILRGEVVLDAERLDLICMALGVPLADVVTAADQNR